MNYKVIFRETIRLFGGYKLPWIFGALIIVCEVVQGGVAKSIENNNATCIRYPLLLLAIYVSLVSKAGLIYSTNQLSTGQTTTFSDVWNFCKTKLFRILGLYFISIPLVMFAVFIPELVKMSDISSQLTFVVALLVSIFLTSLYTLGICAVVNNDMGAGMALWVGLQIVFNKFLHVLTISSFYFILQLLLVVAASNMFLRVIVFVPFTVTMTLAYQVFIVKDSYPALSKI
jgi:hypothetical protein